MGTMRFPLPPMDPRDFARRLAEEVGRGIALDRALPARAESPPGAQEPLQAPADAPEVETDAARTERLWRATQAIARPDRAPR